MPTADVAHNNYLRPNGLGGYIIRQSDLSSWSRCQLQKFYNDRAAVDPLAPQPRSLSATVFGSVVHYCLMLLEKLRHEGRDDAVEVAVASFHHYWHPANLESLPGVEQIDDWLPRQTYGGLKERGDRLIREYGLILEQDTGTLLALEYQFAVPFPIDGRTHTLTGTMDRLAIRKWYNKPYLSIEDFKTGKQPTYLRYHMQGTAYAYAPPCPSSGTAGTSPTSSLRRSPPRPSTHSTPCSTLGDTASSPLTTTTTASPHAGSGG